MKDGMNLLKAGLGLVVLGVVMIALAPTAGIILAFLGVLLTFVGGMQRVRTQREESYEDMVRPQERVHLNKLQKLAKEIETYTLPEKAGQSATVRVLAAEALNEAKAIVDQAARMLNAKAELKKLADGRYEAQRSVKEIETRLQTATPGERAALESALESRSAQVGQYQAVDARIAQVDASLTQAELALSDIKTRLALAAAQEASTDEEGLRESLARAKAISQSFDEAQQMMEDLK